MKKSRFSESKIVKALKENEASSSMQISPELGLANGTLYAWRRRYGGMEVSHMKRSKELEEEIRRLKRVYVLQALKLGIAKEVF